MFNNVYKTNKNLYSVETYQSNFSHHSGIIWKMMLSYHLYSTSFSLQKYEHKNTRGLRLVWETEEVFFLHLKISTSQRFKVPNERILQFNKRFVCDQDFLFQLHCRLFSQCTHNHCCQHKVNYQIATHYHIEKFSSRTSIWQVGKIKATVPSRFSRRCRHAHSQRYQHWVNQVLIYRICLQQTPPQRTTSS